MFCASSTHLAARVSMSIRLLSCLGRRGGGGVGARRCAVLMQHLRRSQGSVAAQEGEEEVVFKDVGDREAGAYRLFMLNRPRALNALNLTMIRRMLPELRAVEENDKLAAVVMEGAGEKAFCAGGDIRAVTEAGKAGLPLAQDFFREEYWLDHALATLSKPYVALLDGITMGGGVGMSVHGPFRVATQHTLFAMPETAIGLFPDVGGSYFLPRLPKKLGFFLALTGHRLRGRDVHHAGVATHFIPREGLPQLREELAALCPHLLMLPDQQTRLAAVRQLLDHLHQEHSTFDPNPFSLQPHLSKIEACFGADSMEGVMSSLKEDGGEWAGQQQAVLARMSPTSLRITLHQLQEGARLTSLEECLRMEYRMGQGCMAGHDFYEGVRSVLVDKDNQPHWQPSSLEEVGEEVVRAHFNALPSNQEWQLPT